jgi:cytidylate kinase
VIITIDGPAGTGKSTVAHLLAHRLGLEFLDTGAMYRALTLLVLESGVRADDRSDVERVVRDADVRFDFDNDPPLLLLNGRAVGEAIRSPAVTAHVSIVAGHPSVREAMVLAQRAIAAVHPRLVTEGRDQGSFVFPDADVKFYLDASVEIRAARRAEQLRRRGEAADVDAIREAIETRDRNDRSRPIGALVRPHEAISIDTGPLAVDEVVELLAVQARERLATLLYAGDEETEADGSGGASA